MGRPPSIVPLKRKHLTLPEDLWRRISDYRFDHRIDTETEAVRELLELALKTVARRAARKKQ